MVVNNDQFHCGAQIQELTCQTLVLCDVHYENCCLEKWTAATSQVILIVEIEVATECQFCAASYNNTQDSILTNVTCSVLRPATTPLVVDLADSWAELPDICLL